MRSLRIEFRQACALLGVLAAGLWSSGCSHLTYVDPNPSAPFAFPGQGMNSAAAAAPANSVWHPAPPPQVTGAQPPAYQPAAAPQISPQPALAPVGFPGGPTVAPP